MAIALYAYTCVVLDAPCGQNPSRTRSKYMVFLLYEYACAIVGRSDLQILYCRFHIRGIASVFCVIFLKQWSSVLFLVEYLDGWCYFVTDLLQQEVLRDQAVFSWELSLCWDGLFSSFWLVYYLWFYMVSLQELYFQQSCLCHHLRDPENWYQQTCKLLISNVLHNHRSCCGI